MSNRNAPGERLTRTGKPFTRNGKPVRGIRCGTRGFTLLELLVVLVILAIVATVAVNSLQPRVDTVRFENTRKVIENVQDAIIGSRDLRQTDGTPLVSGFLADIGRLPRPPLVNPVFGSGVEQGTELGELWSAKSNLATSFPFQFRSGPTQPVDYSSISIPCGWRGPYLNLPIGATTLTDPWGRPFEFEFGETSTIECMVWKPIGDHDEPLKCSLKNGKVIVTGTVNFGQSEPSSVEVVMLGPDPDSSLTELAVFADEDSSPNTYMFSGVAVGMRAIHIRYDDRTLTRYIQVPHQGLTMAIDLTNTNDQTNSHENQ